MHLNMICIKWHMQYSNSISVLKVTAIDTANLNWSILETS